MRWEMFRQRCTARLNTLIYSAQSTLVGAKVDASGQTRLTGDYDTQAKLNFSGLDLGTVLALAYFFECEGAIVDGRSSNGERSAADASQSERLCGGR